MAYRARSAFRTARTASVPLSTGLLVTAMAAACGSAVTPGPELSSSARCDVDFGDPAASEYVLPYTEGRTYRNIQSYCPPDPGWGHYGWYAYDFDLATGDTVVASRAGRVTFVREDRPDVGGNCSGGGENLIVVRHEDGSVMHYVHLTTHGALVVAGARVATGEPIGLSGNSGCSSGPHLHVTLFRDGSASDRTASVPFNYRNAVGPLNANRGLVYGARYTASPAKPPAGASPSS